MVELILTIVSNSSDRTTCSFREALIKLFSYKEDSVLRGPTYFQQQEATAKLERSYWSLMFMSDDFNTNKSLVSAQFNQLSLSYPNVEEALQSYQFYRHLLHSANYKPTAQKQSRNLFCRKQSVCVWNSEAEEFFATLESLALTARTIHLLLSSMAAADSAASTTSAAQEHQDLISAALAELQNPQQKRAAVYDNVDMSRPYAPKVYPKSSEITQLLIGVVQQNVLFRNFKAEEHSRIVEAFDCIEVKAGEIVIKQGDSGEYFYIVESGQLEVYMESCGVHVKIGRTLLKGDYFGELALMYNTPRAATVISTELSTLWRIDRQTYRTIITRHNKETSDEFYGLISNVHILNQRLGDVLSPAEISKVVSTLEVEEFEHGSVIIRQHQTGDYFYIISEGQVDVWQDAIDPVTSQRNALGVKVATLNRGDYFGEKALLADDVRQASCVAVGSVVCLSLSRDDFIAMIGSWQDITGVREAEDQLSKKQRQISVYDSNYHISIRLDDLERLNTLGVGAFGHVSVTRHKESGQLYALKAQAKSSIIAQNMQEMVLNEMKIMKMVDHPLIAKLHATMQDRKYIYFLLELLPGGEFFSFLQKIGKLSEDKARFYSASVILAYEELHRNKIAYRDLKPENMVSDYIFYYHNYRV
jgi:CRP-like cAMP-binding protein